MAVFNNLERGHYRRFTSRWGSELEPHDRATEMLLEALDEVVCLAGFASGVLEAQNNLWR